jgi:hypothetical protein
MDEPYLTAIILIIIIWCAGPNGEILKLKVEKGELGNYTALFC